MQVKTGGVGTNLAISSKNLKESFKSDFNNFFLLVHFCEIM